MPLVAPVPAAAVGAPLACAVPFAARAVSFDAARLRPGRFTYALVHRGEPIGRLVIAIRRERGGLWRFTADGVGFDQHWEAIATRAMRPRRARLAMPGRDGAYTMTVTYRGSLAIGRERDVPASRPAVERATRDRLVRQTIDQRIDWAAMMASGLRSGARIGFDVYDPATGSSRVTAFAEPGTPIRGQPTTRLHYRICKAGGSGEAEDYVVHMTRAAPHVMLREDMRGDLVSTLLEME